MSYDHSTEGGMNLEFDLHIRAKSAPGEVLVLLRFSSERP